MNMATAWSQDEFVLNPTQPGSACTSATFVTPYPPGFSVLMPGQVFSRRILSFMQALDTPQIHGYHPDIGYRVYTQKALEIQHTRHG